MPQGLEVYNSAGTLILDATLNIAKLLGAASIGSFFTGTTQSGSVSDSRLTSLTGNTPFVAVLVGDTWAVAISPRFSIVGNNIFWSFPHATERPNTTFMWGAY